MRLDRLTNKTREALQAAQHDAAARGNPELVPEHLLLALLEQDGGVASRSSSAPASTAARSPPR